MQKLILKMIGKTLFCIFSRLPNKLYKIGLYIVYTIDQVACLFFSYYSDRPTPLRREKTFDLDPKATNKDAKVWRSSTNLVYPVSIFTWFQ